MQIPISTDPPRVTDQQGYFYEAPYEDQIAEAKPACETIRLGDYYVHLPSKCRLDALKPPLSVRERQVLLFTARGFNGPQVAREMNVTPNTVATFKRRILQKLGCRSTAEAIALLTAYTLGAEIEAKMRRQA